MLANRLKMCGEGELASLFSNLLRCFGCMRMPRIALRFPIFCRTLAWMAVAAPIM